MEEEESDERARFKAVSLGIVENQLRANKPPETRQTFDRLVSQGISKEDARILIASAVAVETFEILKSKKEFNHERFVRNLNKLPSQDFDEE